MSGEFRDIGGCSYMWRALQTASLDLGLHEVSAQLAEVYKALQPLEQACAWAEAADSAASLPAEKLLEHGHNIRLAVNTLTALEEKYRQLLDSALRRVSSAEQNIR